MPWVLVAALLFAQISAGTRDYASLLDNYLHGDADAAVAELATWPVADIERHALGRAGWQASIPTLRAVALMHAEAMLRQESAAAALAHFRVGRIAFHTVMSRTGMDAFCVSWQVMVSSLLLAFGDVRDARDIPSSSHPDILLLRASLAEVQATDAVLRAESATRSGLIDRSRHERSVQLLQAERDLRAALKTNPGLIEARVRLGRVLDELERHDAALAELERAWEETQGRGFEAYLAALFLGRVYERAGRHDDAAKAYRGAIETYPKAQTARLALAHLEEGDTTRDASRDDLITVLTPDRDRADPWWVYRYAQYWQIDRRIAELRLLLTR